MENFNTLRSDNSNDVMKYLGEVMTRLSQIESDNSLKDFVSLVIALLFFVFALFL